MVEPGSIAMSLAEMFGPALGARVVEWARGSEVSRLVRLLERDHPAAPKLRTQPDALGELWFYAETGELQIDAMVRAVRPLTATDDEASALVEAIRTTQWRAMRDDRRSHFEFLRLREEIRADLRDQYATILDRIGEALQGFARTLPAARQLPAQVAPFANRERELAEGERLLRMRSDRQVATVVCASGIVGIGKSSLALELAHRHAASFVGGVLYVDLQSPGATDRSAADIAARLLRDLGIAPEAIPGEAGARLAALRSVLAEEPVMLVLDNASRADQVEGMIPANRESVVIVTSRAPLAELPAAHLLELDELREDDGAAVLEAIIGSPVRRDIAAAIVTGSGGLPLALAVVGARARRGQAIERLASSASETAEPLAALDDPSGSVAAALASAVDAASTPSRRLLLLIAALEVVDIDPDVAGVVADVDRNEASRLLEELEGERLLTPIIGGGWRMHQLLRAVAARMARTELGEEALTSAENRRVRWLVASAREHSSDLEGEI